MGNDTIMRVNGVDLAVETFGDPGDPAILLIHGLSASMDWWEEEFCQRLAAGSRFVIRYDHRDTGRSVSYPPGAPAYTGDDLTADAVGVLDALGLARAHVVGVSAGGAIAQEIAVHQPDRVASLTLISTSPGSDTPDLPPPSEEMRDHFANPALEPDWSNRAAVIDYLVDDARHFAARSQPFDEAAMRRLADRIVDRTVNMASSMTNPWILEGGGKPWRERLGELRMPTLVLHGTEDPLFPVEHGIALANEIPGARLITLERTGHELPRRTWDIAIPAILEHTS